MYTDKTIPVKDILTNLGIKKTTFYKYLKAKDTNLITGRSGNSAPISLVENQRKGLQPLRSP